jgi:hypothetical protein
MAWYSSRPTHAFSLSTVLEMVHRKRKVFLTLKLNEPKMHNMHTLALSKPQRFYCGFGLYALHDTKISVLEAKQYVYTSCVFIPKSKRTQI